MIRFRVRPADFDLIEKAAEKVGGIAKWARPILLRAAKREQREGG